jgi:glycine dehydrogenase subunit 1
VADVNAHLLRQGIIGGYDLGQDYPSLAHCMLLAITELNSRADIDRLAAALED